MAILSYLVASLELPLVDRYLSAADYALGFDWPIFYSWVRSQSVISRTLDFAYSCWAPEWLAIPVLLACKHENRVRELTSLGAISALVAVISSAFFPAISAFPYYFPDQNVALPWLQHLLTLRDGSLRSLDLSQMQVLVRITSFHTAGAILFVYVFRGIKVLFPMSVLLNGLVILSTPVSGSHYIVDVLAGIALATFCVLTYRSYPRFRAQISVPDSRGQDSGPRGALSS